MKSSPTQTLNGSLRQKIPSSCRYCDAPLCPLDKDIQWRYWFPDEPICKDRKFGMLDWINNQRKIKKRTLDNSRYFTLEMLKRNCVIRRGIKGLHPDSSLESETRRITTWLSNHPKKKGISSERREELRQRMRKLGGMKE